MTDNDLYSKDDERKVAQGDRALGKLKNRYCNRPLKPRTVLLASLLAAVVLWAAFADLDWIAPVPPPVQESSPRVDKPPPIVAEPAEATDNIPEIPGISPELFARYAEELAMTDAVLTSFFKSLEERQIPYSDLDTKLQEIVGQYKELLTRLETVQSADPEVVRLKEEARQAVEGGDYAKAQELLETLAEQDSLSAATYAELAGLQRVQLRYAKAAEYWMKAAALLPEEEKKDRAYYLNEAGCDLNQISRYSEALSLYEQSLEFSRVIGDRSQEGSILNNLAATAYAKGDYAAALTYLEQSLTICREIGDKKQEAITSWNIGRLYEEQGDLAQAEEHIRVAVQIAEQINHPSLEEWCKALEKVRAKPQE